MNRIGWLVATCVVVSSFFIGSTKAQTQPAPVERLDFAEEVLPNGLHVIYAPLHQAPVVHVRVLYHVGSRDERPDRQGFAHMFEHMMFRGSAHVPPQEHMKLVDEVGGYSNAFTSFDQTVYIDTVPAEDLEMALYLEADRMSSFKVSEEIYKIERKVVAEEWRMQQNRPYGTVYQDFLKTAYTTHSYRWTPIGNMDHLLAAPVSELQDFFNTYYVPNNAILVIAGDINVKSAKQIVGQYFGWIPRGGDVPRLMQPEPPQTAPRSATVPDRVPLADIIVGWHIPPYKSDEQYPISVLSTVLGEGASSRLHRLLVSGEKPLCIDASTIVESLEDSGVFGLNGTVLLGKKPPEVEKVLNQAMADIVAHGITEEELNKAKTLRRVETLRARQTASDIASDFGDELMFGGNADRVNHDLEKLDAVTASDVQAVAAKYMQPAQATTLLIQPDPLGLSARKASTAASAISKDAPVAPSTEPVKAKEVHFPDGYPEHPPMAEPRAKATFEKGEEISIDGVRVIVMRDSRLPLVNWNLTLRRGSNSDPSGKEGLASLTAEMLRRGAGNLDYAQLNEELESHGITLGVSDGGDCTHLVGSCTTEQLDRGLARSRDILLAPTFPEAEFDKLKEQTVSSLAVSLETPTTVGDLDLLRALFGGTPLGHPATPASVNSVTLDDVKNFYRDFYHPNDALLVISGDVTVDRGRVLAKQLLDGWAAKELPALDYSLGKASAGRKIILVDRPGGKGATIRIGIRSYDNHTDEKFAGSIASTILSSGIESRLGRYVRAEKGYVYGVRATFQPGRHAGSFSGSTETRLETTADTLEAMFKVFDDMRKADVTDDELQQAKRRVIGSMVMSMQTIAQQADLRTEGILNDYPIDYYDVYPSKIATVTAQQVRDTMQKYVDDSAMTIVVVAPAADVKEQLEKLGEVQVLPMPAKRGKNPSSQPSAPDLLKPTG